MVRSNLRLKRPCRSRFCAGLFSAPDPGASDWCVETYCTSLRKRNATSSMPTWMDRTRIDLKPKTGLVGLTQWGRTSP